MADEVVDNKTGTISAASKAVLDKIIKDSKMVLDPNNSEAMDAAAHMLREFAQQAAANKIKADEKKGILKALGDAVARLDEELTRGLNELMHAPEFQRLESTWRGLHGLVKNSETGERLKLRLLNTNKGDLFDDLTKAVDVDQSQLFKKIYEEEYGTYGGAPYSMLVADLSIGRNPSDMILVKELARVAAMAHAPLIAAADPALFDLASFTDLGKPRDLSKTFEAVDAAEWRAFRNSEDSRYVALTLPRYLLRLPYGEKTRKVTQFTFEEFGAFNWRVDDDGEAVAPSDPDQTKRHDAYLWGNSAYLLAQRVTAAFARYGWSAAIRGVEGGGAVEDLPVHTFNTGEGDLVMKCPTEVTITDRREKELNDLGFIAVVHKKNENVAAFFGGQTVNKPISYNLALANANAALSSKLPCMLAASRFAHYIKVIMRDKIGSFASRDNVETFLNNWIADYVLVNDNASQSLKAQFPLREARIDVTEDPAKPGVYKATVFLRPHFQLEELTASIRMVASLPAPVGG
ncbi:type VI secretion system contractile sheath large subunit [Rugamonas rubra]|uniref:Type VI secretion system protein ImpC n=1 Tax=Rugamonas rubra TaxID=758825 RepID=A0A1I4TSI5_9BURK|nr:type VI secretion system contractile sheath large subunit [Rugamonas rubra]SFM79503.1 type VI secretion system protein ImpC [Rugamonas rubra]